VLNGSQEDLFIFLLQTVKESLIVHLESLLASLE
jgi:hypothetical protein